MPFSLYFLVLSGLISLCTAYQYSMKLPFTNSNAGSLSKQSAIAGLATCGESSSLDFKQIIRCKAKNNYTHFYFMGQRRLVVARTLGDYENSLPSQLFVRIHRSDIINISHVRKHDKHGNMWLSDGTRLAISKRRKSRVLKILQAVTL